MPKNSADENALESLHGALAKDLTARIVNGEEHQQGDETVIRPASAALLNVARGFLKDNNIECAPNHPSNEIVDLRAAMLEAGDEDEVPEFKH